MLVAFGSGMRPIVRSGATHAAALIVALAAAAATGASANEIPATGSARGITIHGTDQTLRDYTREDSNGRLWLELPGGIRFELILSPADPAITNPGDGAFHAFDEGEVRSALAGVRYPLDAIGADVFILPYPRRDGLESAAGPRLILLSPGVRPLPREQQHAELVHELGHVVQQALLPDGDQAGWQTYRAMRGIDDGRSYNAASPHANRPHEIFAEDFRVLFGDGLSNYSGSIENASLADPRRVDGLSDFILGLSGVRRVTLLHVTPNPARGSIRFFRAGGVGSPLDLFDTQGRRVTTLEPVPTTGGVQWNWGGTDLRGRRVEVGVLFARVRDATATVTRVTILP
jgi:hypothetical protein